MERDLKILEGRLTEYTDNRVNDFNIDKKMELIDEINCLKESIAEVGSNREEIDYLLNSRFGTDPEVDSEDEMKKKSIDFECRGDQEAAPGSGRDCKGIDF